MQAAPLPGTAALTGTVESTAPFKAAQVHIRNVDKRMLYMVYTQAGQFRSVKLFPGNYEINVVTKGLDSEVQKLVLKPGDNPKVTLSLRASNEKSECWSSPTTRSTRRALDATSPSGPASSVTGKTSCRPAYRRRGWNSRLDRMMGKANSERAAASYAQGLLSYRDSELRFSRQDREDLLAYLVKNFGPGAKPRNVRIDQETPLDEAKLGKAMYIEYYLTADPPGKGGRRRNAKRRTCLWAAAPVRMSGSMRTAMCG